MDTQQQPVTRRTEVFISAATADLSTARARVKLAVDTIGGHGVYQEEFPPDYRTLEAMLRGHIQGCDAVIHIAGISYGSEPKNRPSDAARRSYTQLEFDIAQELGRPLYVFVCAETFPYDSHQQEAADLVALQTAHRAVCLARPEFREKIGTTLELEKRVSQLRDHLRSLERQVLDTSKAVKAVGDTVEAGPKKEIRAKLNLAQALVRQEKHSEGVRELEEALALAQAAKLGQEEVETLLMLGLLSASQRERGNCRGYLDQAEKKLDHVTNPTVRVLYFRTIAAACDDEQNRQGAEQALRSALQCCSGEKEDNKNYLETQACVVRSQLIILLCEQGRKAEAADLVPACDMFARAHSKDEDGALVQAAMGAGIFWGLKTGNEGDAVARIHELEAAATTTHQASRIGGQLVDIANNSSCLGFHHAAMAAAESAVRLEQKLDNGGSGLLAALYTVAFVTFYSGDHATARRKAEALLDACNDPKDASIKQAARLLIAEVARLSGDSETAVTLASEALASASGRPEVVASRKQAVARALSDNGQTEEALAQSLEAYELMRDTGMSPLARADVLFQIVGYASVLGRTAETSEALAAIALLESDLHGFKEDAHSVDETKEKALRLAEINTTLRDGIITIASGDWGEVQGEISHSASLQQANAQVVKPLLSVWDEIPSEYFDSAVIAYDFWGRGNFARIVRNAQTIRGTFNITLEVRTLDGVKQAIRLWCLYADMLLLIWKGPTEDGNFLDGLPDTVCNGPGGAGYLMSLAEQDDNGRHHWFCMGHASCLPDEVIAFLMTEARSLLAAGRVIVVPATGVGCVHPGHGPLEQLLAESANAVAGLRSSEKSNEVAIGMMPYSPDAPFKLLADIIEAQQSELRKLRRLLIRRTRELAPHEAGIIANRELTLEIQDSLRELEDRQSAIAYKRGLSSAKERINGGLCRFHRDGSRLLPTSEISHFQFAPLLTLQNFGYNWGVGSPGSKPQGRYEPGKGSVVGPWLAPPTEGWAMLTMQKVE